MLLTGTHCAATVKSVDTSIRFPDVAAQFCEKYPKFRSKAKTPAFKAILKHLIENRHKLIWAIEDMDMPPLAGVARGLLELGVDFEDDDTRRMAGAMIACVLSDQYHPTSSGHRVNRWPFRTASKYERKSK